LKTTGYQTYKRSEESQSIIQIIRPAEESDGKKCCGVSFVVKDFVYEGGCIQYAKQEMSKVDK